MKSEEIAPRLHLFKAAELEEEEEEKKLPRANLRAQIGQLKVKCAASLCILLILLIEVIARRIENSTSTLVNFVLPQNGSSL